MNSIVKINSNEGGQFNAQNNRVSFDLPADKYYDLSSSYLNLVMSCDVTVDPDANLGVGVAIPVVRFTGSNANVENYAYENSALIRTATLDCELKGNIEELQRADILTQNLNSFSKSTDMETSHYYEKLIQPFGVSRNKSSLFCDINKEGDIPSRNLSRQPIRIKMSDLMNFCKTTQYNTGKYGRTRLELELNLDRLAPVTQSLSNAAADWLMTNNAGIGGGTNECGRFMNASNSTAGGTFGTVVSGDLKTFYVCADTAAGVATGIVPRIFNRLEDSPYFVGQKLQLNATYVVGAGGAARGGDIVNQSRRIIKIEYNRGDGVGNAQGVNRAGTIAITLDTAIDGGGNLSNLETYHSIKVTGLDATFGNGVVADYAELVVEEIAPSNVQPEPETIQYTTYKTEEIDCGGVLSFQHTFQAEPNAITMYVTQPTDNTNRCILSRQNVVSNYRIRINNKDTSARNISLRDGGTATRSGGNDPLHIVKQQNALVNSERDISDFKERLKNQNTNDGATFASYDVNTMLIGQVLPMTAQPKQIQVNINCDGAAGLKNLCVFREVLEEL